jgi:two-component system response regulator AtoC
VRIIAATNKNLTVSLNEGKFREDLYYRLNVIPIDIVPLRQRGDDILLLFRHYLEYFSKDMGFPPPSIDPDAQEILLNYKWPGNVRELRNVAQRLVLNSTDHIGVKDVSNPMILKNSVISKENSIEELYGGQVLTLREMEKAFRLKYFKYVRSISSSDANAAEKLGIAPSNFYRMCKELGLK